MFYLKQFFLILRTNKVLGILFFLSCFLTFSLSYFKADIQKELSLEGKINGKPYFSALLRKNISVNNVQRRMSQLPGVAKVEIESNKNIKSEVSRLKSVFGSDIVNNLASIEYQKLRIELESGLKAKSLTLIQEYLSRLVGKDFVTIGSVKKPRSLKLKKQDWLYVFLEWANTYALVICLGLWLITNLLLLRPLIQHSYIIQKFQRKAGVSYKILASGISLSFAMTFILSITLKREVIASSILIGSIIILLPFVSMFIVNKLKKIEYGY